MKDFLKRITGLKKIEEKKARLENEIAVAEQLARQKLEEMAEAEKALELAKLTPKERATQRQEPWVAVLDTKVNKDNVRNGFFELDWNEYFINDLIKAGYGYEADPPEEIVDRWFRDLARNLLAEEGQDSSRGAGFINVNRISQNQSEIS